MRILIYNWRDLAHPKAGGAEVYTHEVARHWARSGHEVTLFCSAVEGAPERDKRAGVDIVRRGGRHSVYTEAARFYRDEGQGKFDLVIDEVNTRPFMCARYVKDAPVVALFHQLAREVWHHEVPKAVAYLGRYILEPRWLRSYRDVPVLTVSKSSAESLYEHGIHDVKIVPEGMSVPDVVFEHKKEPVPTVVFCGRLAANKRPDHALKAFHLLQAKIPEAQMWFVGSGPMQAKLQRAASPNVTFFGRVSNEEKFKIMSKAHALVATSVREGWGLVVSEAAAVGTPAVAYDVPGLRDSVGASSGVLAAPQPAALAEQLMSHLPLWFKHAPHVEAGEVLPWNEVADEILRAALGVVDVRNTNVVPVSSQDVTVKATAEVETHLPTS